MSPTGLQKFINGSRPYSATREKLERWFVTQGDGDVGVEMARSALAVLVQDLPPADRVDATRKLVGTLSEIYDKTELPPRWIAALEADLGIR